MADSLIMVVFVCHIRPHLSDDVRKPVFGSGTNRPVQSQKKARSLKFGK